MSEARTVMLCMVATVVLTLSGCAGRNVVFTSSERTGATAETMEAPPCANQRERGTYSDLTVFVDRYGALYPPENINVPTNSRGDDRSDLTYATVRALIADSETDSSDLIAHVGLPEGSDIGSNWNAIQKVLRDNLVASVSKRTDGTAPLVVLVHGYNNTYCEAREWYDLVSTQVRAERPDAVVLRLHWDGLTKRPLHIWGPAQYNAVVAGVGLRPLFKELGGLGDGSQPIRTLTHSTGALLMANVLNDASASAQCAKLHGACDRVKDPETFPDSRNHRVAMVIPAISPDTFTYFRDNSIYVPERLIFGLNNKDGPTSKYVLNCKHGGSTCMNINRWRRPLACHSLDSAFRGLPTDVYLFDFAYSPRLTRDRDLLFWEQHGIRSLASRAPWRSMLHALLADEQAITDDWSRVCVQAPPRIM